MIRIWCNEKEIRIQEGVRLYALRDQRAPQADILVLNGAPMEQDMPIREDDRVVLIERGKQPAPEELEALMMARHTPGVHAKIKDATVGIAGCGGLGSAIAIALTRIGIGRLIIADFDVVEASNLNRQQYFIDQIGLLKVDALRANLARINPYVTIQSHAVRLRPSNVAEIFKEAVVMVEALDRAEAKAMLAEVYAQGLPDRPLVMASGVAGYEKSNSIQSRAFGKNLIIVGDRVTEADQHMGLMAPRVGIAAHHQANAVLRLLLGESVG